MTRQLQCLGHYPLLLWFSSRSGIVKVKTIDDNNGKFLSILLFYVIDFCLTVGWLKTLSAVKEMCLITISVQNLLGILCFPFLMEDFLHYCFGSHWQYSVSLTVPPPLFSTVLFLLFTKLDLGDMSLGRMKLPFSYATFHLALISCYQDISFGKEDY